MLCHQQPPPYHHLENDSVRLWMALGLNLDGCFFFFLVGRGLWGKQGGILYEVTNLEKSKVMKKFE